MKKIILGSILTTSLLSVAQESPTAATGLDQPASQPAVTAAPTAKPVASRFSSEAYAAAAVDKSKTKETEVKAKKRPSLWKMLTSFSIMGIVKHFEKLRDDAKQQNLEAIEGAETGIWKHTKRRVPANGKAKEIADKLDKIQQERLDQFDKIEAGFNN